MSEWRQEPSRRTREYIPPLSEYEQSHKAVLARRLAAEKAYYERGLIVAGHDFAQEAWERLRPQLKPRM